MESDLLKALHQNEATKGGRMESEFNELPMGIAPTAWNAMVKELANRGAEIERLKAQVNAHRCEDCGGELTCCGPMTEDGPLLDCLLCQRSEIIAKLKAQLSASEEKRKVLGAEVKAWRKAWQDVPCSKPECSICLSTKATDAASALEAP